MVNKNKSSVNCKMDKTEPTIFSDSLLMVPLVVSVFAYNSLRLAGAHHARHAYCFSGPVLRGAGVPWTHAEFRDEEVRLSKYGHWTKILEKSPGRSSA